MSQKLGSGALNDSQPWGEHKGMAITQEFIFNNMEQPYLGGNFEDILQGYLIAFFKSL